MTFMDVTHEEDINSGLEGTPPSAREEVPSFSMEKRYVRKKWRSGVGQSHRKSHV